MTQPVAKGEDGGEHVAGHKLGAGFQHNGECCKDIVRAKQSEMVPNV
jgi:hypothetical protein